MRNYRDLITSPENLAWAWRKARRLYLEADGFVDFGEIAEFELDIERQLELIGRDLAAGAYKLTELAHLPQPKKPDENGPRMRQFFHIAVRDQVAWLAIANVIGPTLDYKMPKWSYGNRLYKAAWWEDHDGSDTLQIGPYRHSSGRLYRKFQHSWPLFRRHLSLTARAMVDGIGDPELLDEPERHALQYEERPAYLYPDYWPALESKMLFHASLDLERFYPSITTQSILRAFESHLDGFSRDLWLKPLLSKMLAFTISDKNSCRLADDLVQPVTEAGAFPHIPTGLMVAGLLANAAMLPIDDEVERALLLKRNVAHFRFVDDHAILAPDFDALVAWIKDYEAILKRYDIGAKISASKYEPERLATVIDGSADPTVTKQVAKEAELDGAQPVRLITKTLALVSDLANAEFDILPEQSRTQRLGELEWLLLASMPDTEIRADTRAAFAAGKIAQLVPVAFSPSPDLVKAWRKLSRLQAVKPELQAPDYAEAFASAKAELTEHSTADLKRYQRLIGHYFTLVERAFTDHPNRARLLLRLFRYCRMTGHGGFADTLGWIVSQTEGSHGPTADYLSALTLQALATNITAAAFDVGDRSLLYRERVAARRFLLAAGNGKSVKAVRAILGSARERHCCDASALAAFQAAVAFALAVSARKSGFAPIATRMTVLAEAIAAPQLTSDSAAWKHATGRPIGVWVHLLEMLGRAREPSLAWRISAQGHDPAELLDWIDLRKHPEKLPPHAAEFLRTRPPRDLTVSDAGWLLDYRRSAAVAGSLAIEDSPAGHSVKAYEKERLELDGFMSLLEWTKFLGANKQPSDPRASEWTALEIIRRLLDHVTSFGTGSIADLDELHPANILLDRAWTEGPAKGTVSTDLWTWTAWHAHARSAPLAVVTQKIEDYRRQPLSGPNLDPAERWTYQLRGSGLLLLGLVTKDFSLPAWWNVRGLERDIAAFVRHRLEEAIISSRSQAIIEAATLPRSIETRLIQRAPWAFFGDRTTPVITDTRNDPPLLRDIEDLKVAIANAQAVLEHNQLTVLNHAPRQLIPMNIIQLSQNAVAIPDIEA